MTSTLDAPISATPKMPPTGPVSFEQFHDWLDEGIHAEWVDGEIQLMSPNNIEHQDVIGFLYLLLRSFVEPRRLGRVFFAGVLMRLATRPSGREPDLMFVSTEHTDRLKETYLDGPADLVIEIVSPDSYVRDRGEKFLEYEGAGIPEYWVVDPTRSEAVFYRLGADGRYHVEPIDPDGWYTSKSLAGFRLKVDWLWQRPLPAVEKIVRETAV